MWVTAAESIPAGLSSARPRTLPLSSSVAFFGMALLLLVAPFELLQPVIRLPWQSVSDVELAIVLAGGAWAVSLWCRGDRQWWWTPLTAAWAALVGSLLLSALFAPAWRTNALHMAGRVGVAAGIFFMTAAGATTADRIRWLMRAAAIGALAVAGLAILEYLAVGPVLSLLRLFRPGISVVGEQVRATGSLQYPTITSMYLEIAFAFALGLFADAMANGFRTASWGWAIAACVMAEAIVVTFTRAGLVTVAVSLAIVGIRRIRSAGTSDKAFLGLMTIAVVVVVELVASHSFESTRLRLTTEGQDAWYRAEITAPATLDFHTDRTRTVRVTLVNRGLVAWDSTAAVPVLLSYHWLLLDEDRVVAYEGTRTEFPQTVEPGTTITLDAAVRAPRRPGRYRLLWDVVEEGRRWFSTEPDPTLTFSVATVTGLAAGAPDDGPLRPLPRPAVRPRRFVLWRAAAKMFAAHPLLGVGPDNFRLSYGSSAGIEYADPRVHTNNMYLEIAVGAGLLGAAAFSWLLGSSIGVFWRLGTRSRREELIVASGVVAAGAAIGVHGFVDSFMSFTPTYVLMAATIGLAAAGVGRAAGEPDAHRV